MTHISKRRLDPKIYKEVLSSLSFILKDIDSQNEMEKFLSSAISDTERLMIGKRVIAAFLLRHDVESEKIANALKLTPATVARLKLWVQTHQEGFNIVFEKLEKRRRNEFAKKVLYTLLEYANKLDFGRIENPFPTQH